MKRVCSALITAVLVSGGMTVAQEEGEKPYNIFKQLDKNEDGKLQPDEIPEAQKRFFDRIVRLGDDNDDGTLTRNEFDKATAEATDRPQTDSSSRRRGARSYDGQFNAKQFFDRLDQNKDGKIEKSELPPPLQERLRSAFDKLGKDSVTLEEFQKLRPQSSGRSPGQGDRPNGSAQRQYGDPAEGFKRLDKNGDGKLTLNEVPDQARRFIGGIFERSGKGKDGSLSVDEFTKAITSVRGRQDADRSRESQRRSGQASSRNSGNSDMRRPGQYASMPRFFAILDADRNGRLDRDELAKAVSLLDRLDENKDGALDGRELFGRPSGQGRDSGRRPSDRPDSDRRQSDRPRRPDTEGSTNRTDRPDSNSDRRSRDRASGADRGAQLKESFARMDRDKDGAISEDEAGGRLKEYFKRVDQDSDKKITLEELTKLYQRVGESRRNRETKE